MTRTATIPALLALLACCCGCASTGEPSHAPWDAVPTAQTQVVDKAVDVACRHTGTAAVGVAYLDLASSNRVLRQELLRFHAASTVKVPVMIATWAAIEDGALSLEQPIAVHNGFRSIIDGSRYQLAPADDSDPDLYAAIGSTRPLAELMRRMIVRSSNLATNLIVDQLGPSRIMDTMRQMGIFNLQILRGVADEKAFQAGFNNEIDATDLMNLLAGIARAAAEPDAATATPIDPGDASAIQPGAARRISHRAALAMLEILEAQELNDKIPAGLPPGTTVAHKTGDITGVHHDASIIYAPGESPYVLVVLTNGFASEADANRFIANLSRVVWQARHAPPPVEKPAKGARKPHAAR
jgi:beta-lactamase class A